MGNVKAFLKEYVKAIIFFAIVILCGSIFVGVSAPKAGFTKGSCLLKSATISYNESDPMYSEVVVVADVYDGTTLVSADVVSNDTYTSAFAANIFTKCCLFPMVNQSFDCVFRYSKGSGDKKVVEMIPWYIYPVSLFAGGIILLFIGVVVIMVPIGLCLNGGCNKGKREGDQLLEQGSTISEVTIGSPRGVTVWSQ